LKKCAGAPLSIYYISGVHNLVFDVFFNLEIDCGDKTEKGKHSKFSTLLKMESICYVSKLDIIYIDIILYRYNAYLLQQTNEIDPDRLQLHMGKKG